MSALSSGSKPASRAQRWSCRASACLQQTCARSGRVMCALASARDPPLHGVCQPGEHAGGTFVARGLWERRLSCSSAVLDKSSQHCYKRCISRQTRSRVWACVLTLAGLADMPAPALCETALHEQDMCTQSRVHCAVSAGQCCALVHNRSTDLVKYPAVAVKQ